MKKWIYMTALAMTTLTASAQETYEMSRLLGGDLNGTARYVGMGGALEALGADISTISTNPAGIGMFRHSSVSGSFGVVSQQDASTFDGLGKTNASFDQLGFVYSMQTGATSYFNFAINYHKSHNFDQILSAANRLNAASLNKLSYLKYTLGNEKSGGYDLWWSNGAVDIQGYENESSSNTALTYSQVDYLNANTLLIDENGTSTIDDDYFVYYDANGFEFDRAHRGYISNYDINLSGNINNRVYLGITLGIHDVNYQGRSLYREQLIDLTDAPIEKVNYSDDRHIKGTGADLKLGAIFRPIDESPFRVGLYFSTPTWYDLRTYNYSELYGQVPGGDSYKASIGDRYDDYKFKFYTPWTFGLSVGHTIDNYLALGASFEYTDNSTADIRENTGYYDSYGDEESESDHVMNENVERSLKGTSTLKLGAEFKPDPSLAVRLGYNYVSPMYSDNGFRDTQLASVGVAMSSAADYTNWQSTHRVTCGLGYKIGHVNVDLAYQYSVRNGDFYPFQNCVTYLNEQNRTTTITDFTSPTSVSFKRHQLLLTLGYTF